MPSTKYPGYTVNGDLVRWQDIIAEAMQSAILYL